MIVPRKLTVTFNLLSLNQFVQISSGLKATGWFTIVPISQVFDIWIRRVERSMGQMGRPLYQLGRHGQGGQKGLFLCCTAL